MSSDIRIRKGLDIQLKGKADAITKPAPLAAVYGIKPAEFHRVIPKLIAREGATLKAGDAVFYDKRDERVLFPSPVSGTITEIIRGERRKILEIRITPDATQSFQDFGKKEVNSLSPEQIK